MPSPSSASPVHTVYASLSNQAYTPAINALLSGTAWGSWYTTDTSLTISYSFPWTSNATAVFSGYKTTSYSNENQNTAAQKYGLNNTQIAAAELALQAWANVADIRFTETKETSTSVGDIRFAFTSNIASSSWGGAYPPDNYWPYGGDIWISTLYASSSDWSVGSYNYEALMHEIGHAIGLKHPFEGTNTLPSSVDYRSNTIMSYTNPSNSLFVRVSSSNDSYSYDAFNVSPETPMLYDIAAIQYIYGANTSYKTGDDTYSFATNDPFYKTIWDAGGNDTISVSNFSKACTIDLNQGHFSKISIASDDFSNINWQKKPPTPSYDGTDNLAIAYNCIIENAIGGSGNDTLIGNEVANKLEGGAGNDTLYGNDGNDELLPGAGNNMVYGGSGIDTCTFTSLRSDYQLSWSGSTLRIQDSKTNSLDQLTDVERLKFSDESLAFDLDDHAGKVLKLISAVFGKDAIYNKKYVGIGLELIDSGTSYTELADYALKAYGANDNDTIVTTLWNHVVHTTPTRADKAPYLAMLEQGTSPGTLGVFAADSSYNLNQIDLIGLSKFGIEYI